ncbi:hypothetical protein TURU_054236 [Turdus rufiventris]|nr:hypothetical protein TURU_054236 [Turdus rufiventris]
MAKNRRKNAAKNHSKKPLKSGKNSDLYAEYDTIEYDLSLWSVGISPPGYVPSQLLVHPQSLHWWSGVRSRKILDVSLA